MKIFELSKKKYKNGKRPFKAVLHKIYQSEDEWNENGITWLREPVESNIESAVGASITCEFVNEARDEILGHGETGVQDGIPVFENASMVGVFTKAYVGEIEIDGEKCLAAIGEGHLDGYRYANLIRRLEEDIVNGEYPDGSVEIVGLPENENKIVYRDGWKEKGRIPVSFSYSGFALLKIRPSDPSAKLVELNNKIESEEQIMDEKVLSVIVDSVKNTIVETNSKNDEYEKQIETLNATIVETNASVETIQAALDSTKEELQKKYDESDSLYKELEILRAEVAEAKVKEKVGELNSALAEFSDEEKAFAKDEIAAFEADPTTIEINSIVDKVYTEVGKKAKETEKISETNAAKNQEDIKLDDIFADILETNSSKSSDEDESIF